MKETLERLDLHGSRFDDTSAIQVANLFNNASNKSITINNFQDYYTFEIMAPRKGFLGIRSKRGSIKVTRRAGNVVIAEIPTDITN